jgi:plastocyanin
MGKLLAAAAAVMVMAALTTSALAGAPPVKHATVDVDGYAFSPGTLRIKPGTKVVWKWVDGSDVRHDVHVLRGPAKFHSKLIARGTYAHLFTKAGKYVLYCTVHPQIMRETVIVR